MAKRVKKKNKKSFSLKEEYKHSWLFIKEIKNFIYFGLAIFLFFVLLGFIFPVPEQIYEKIIEMINELVKRTEGLSQFELIKFILLNNLQSSFASIVYGTFFGLVPFFASALNGYLLGFVASASVGAGGISSLWKILPHGIFELPAIFISFGMGLKMGSFIFQEKKLESLFRFFKNSIRVFILVIIPLLIIAAIIEGSLIALFS